MLKIFLKNFPKLDSRFKKFTRIFIFFKKFFTTYHYKKCINNIKFRYKKRSKWFTLTKNLWPKLASEKKSFLKDKGKT